MASSGNFCTWNRINAQGGGTPDLTRSGTLTQGNLNYNPGSYGIIIGSVGVQTGKWYWELRATGLNASGPVVGWLNERHTSGGSNYPSPGYSSPSSAANAQFIMLYLLPGSGPSEIVAGTPSGSSSGTDTDKSGISANDIIGVAGDFDNNKWYFSINGSFTDMRSGQNPATGSNPLCSESSGGGLETFTRVSGLTWYPTYGNWSGSSKASYTNFGQDSTFGGGVSAGGNADENGFGDFKYSVPTGFLAMCSANLPISDDIDPAQTDDNFPGKQFGAITYTGTGSSNAITGLGFQPDFMWNKRRNNASAYSNSLVDSTRGRSKVSYSQRTQSEATSGSSEYVVSFESDCFTLGTNNQIDINGSGGSATYVAWCWKANAGTTASNTEGGVNSTTQANTAAGFSIVTYTGIAGASGASTVGHGLSKAPEFILHVSRTRAAGRWVQHVGTSGSSYVLQMATSAETDYSGYGTIASPTATTFGINGIDGIGGESADYVAYVWHSVEGYSKFGTYEGNGNSNGPFIYTGFRPQLIAIKNIEQSSNWVIYDSARQTFNPNENYLRWNSSATEGGTSTSFDIDFFSNGYKVRSTETDLNTSGKTFVYCAWGDVPFKYNNTF